jgi:hypothetical protein
MAVYRFSIETNVFFKKSEQRQICKKKQNEHGFFFVHGKKHYITIFRLQLKTKRTSFYLDQNTILKRICAQTKKILFCFGSCELTRTFWFSL